MCNRDSLNKERYIYGREIMEKLKYKQLPLTGESGDYGHALDELTNLNAMLKALHQFYQDNKDINPRQLSYIINSEATTLELDTIIDWGSSTEMGKFTPHQSTIPDKIEQEELEVEPIIHGLDKHDHFEVSDGDTLIVAISHCPLTEQHPDLIVNNTSCCINCATKCDDFYKLWVHNGDVNVQCAQLPGYVEGTPPTLSYPCTSTTA